MAEYPIPPWLVNHTDPVQAYAHGLQIGSSIGEAQSRQQLAQEQMLREQQKDLVNQEIKKQTFQLKADAAAKRYAAEQKFQQLIQSGVDPSQAILQVPALGNELTPMVNMLRSRQMTPYQQQMVDLRKQELDAKKEGKEYGDIQTVDLGGGVRAAFRPGSPGLHLITPKGDKSLSPTAAASVLSKIPEMDAMAGTSGTTNSLATTLAPSLLDIIRKSTKPQENAQPNEVIRVTKDGKQAVFDSNTKKFLRYADNPDMGGDDSTGDSTDDSE